MTPLELSEVVLQVVASPTIIILTTLEVSFMLLEITYSTGVTHEDHHLRSLYFIAQATRVNLITGNTKGESITVPLTSCLTGLDQSVLQTKTKIVSCHTANSKPVKQEVNSTVILPPLVFTAYDKFLRR
jgi:hypothetical protein